MKHVLVMYVKFYFAYVHDIFIWNSKMQTDSFVSNVCYQRQFKLSLKVSISL